MLKRKWVALIMAGVMTAGLTAGCGTTEEPVSDAAVKETDGAQTVTEEENSSADSKYNVTWDDMAEITVLYDSMGPVPSGLKAVEDEINKITEAEINTHVNLVVYEIGSYDQQVGLLMSSGESVDLLLTMPGGSSSFSIMRSQGQLQEMSELLSEYGQPVLDTVGDLIEATTVNGGIYAVPIYKDLASFIWIVMRTDVLEDLGLLEKATNMTSMEEYEEIMQAVKDSEKWNYLAPIAGVNGNLIFTTGGGCIGENNFSDMSSFDMLGDTLSLVSLPSDGSDSNVQVTFATEEYRKMWEMVSDWYDKGLVYKDSATEENLQLIKSNVTFSFITEGESNVESAQTVQSGMPVTCVKVYAYPITTSSCIKFTWGIPSTAQEPEAAVTFLSMMYTDSRIANLLAWGIEGTDYEVTDGIAHYIEGNENPAYHMNDYSFGNQFIITPWDGTSVDYREISKELSDSTPRSAYFGFIGDTEPITNEIASLSGVLSQYRGQIETGMADEAAFNEFLNKLEASGVNKVVECYQQQIDEWMKNH